MPPSALVEQVPARRCVLLQDPQGNRQFSRPPLSTGPLNLGFLAALAVNVLNVFYLPLLWVMK
jgi:hypothetical protein